MRYPDPSDFAEFSDPDLYARNHSGFDIKPERPYDDAPIWEHTPTDEGFHAIDRSDFDARVAENLRNVQLVMGTYQTRTPYDPIKAEARKVLFVMREALKWPL